MAASEHQLVLEASSLSKSFGDLSAVKNLSLKIERGQCLAILGPNGAGKTTTCEMLEGLIKPDVGTIKICGKLLSKENLAEIKEIIGVQLQETKLYKKYTVLETFQLFASLYKNSLSPESLLERLGLSEKKDTWLQHLSGGQQQRVYLGVCLINDPQILFLDEPTTGLDPATRRAMWDLLLDFKSENRALLLTSHYMEEAERLADHVAIIDHGEVIAEGKPNELISKHCGGEIVWFSVISENQESVTGADALKHLSSLIPELNSGLAINQGVEITVDKPLDFIQLLKSRAESNRLKIDSIQIRKPTLEDVFLKLTGRSMRDA